MKAEKASLWLSEKTAKRCKAKGVAGKTVVLKMKADRLSSLTRNVSPPDPTQLADVMFEKGSQLLRQVLAEHQGQKFRLIGIGVSGLVDRNWPTPPIWPIRIRRDEKRRNRRWTIFATNSEMAA